MNWTIPRGPVVKYYVYLATTSRGFIEPIAVLYLLSRGLTYAEFGVISSIFWAGWVLSEIPTGYVGDRIGRRNSLLVGMILYLLAMIGFVFATSFLAFAIVHAVWSTAQTFRSGTGDAWLYDLLKDRLDEDEFSRVRGRGRSFSQGVTAVGAVLGGVLYSVNRVSPFLVTAGLIVVGIGAVLTFPKSGPATDDDETFTVLDALPVLRTSFTQPPLRSFLVYSALFTGVVWMAWMFVQPISTNLGVPPRHIGWIYAGFTAVAAGVSYFTGEIKDAVGIQGWFLTMPFVVGVLFLAVTVYPLVALPLFFVMRVVDSLTGTLQSQFLNDNIQSVGRATVLSTAMMVYAVTQVAFRSIAGWIAGRSSPIVALGVFGGLLLVGAGLVIVWESPIRTERVEQAT
jgi:MFS family permease